MKVLVLGTSNCLLTGGMKNAVEQYFGVANVENISLGGASGTFLALFRFIEGIDFSNYDYVFLDSIVNEQWQFRDSRSLTHLKNIATVFYSCLPAGVTYVYLGFCTSPRFHRADPVEQIHRSLCNSAGVNFISFREILVEFGLINGFQQAAFYPYADAGHYKPSLVFKLALRLFEELPTLPKKTLAPCLDRSFFSIQDVKRNASTTEKHTTSLRTQEYGVFVKGSTIVPDEGCFLGFDFVALNTEAYLHVIAEGRIAEGRRFFKALHFKADRPWMKVAGFYNETISGPGSLVKITDEPDTSDTIEPTEATSQVLEPLHGQARLASFFFARLPISELRKRFSSADVQAEPALANLHDRLVAYLQDNLEDVRQLLFKK